MTVINRLSRCKPLLGTYVEVELSGTLTDAELLHASQLAFLRIEAVHQAMSFHREDSELTRINREASQSAMTISDELRTVLEQGLLLSQASAGIYDLSMGGRLVAQGQLPDHGFVIDERASWQDIELNGSSLRFHKPLVLDLGGIAKGFAVDEAFSALEPFMDRLSVNINAGGDLRMSDWCEQSVGIKSPANPEQLHVVTMQNAALASSACYYLEHGSVIYSPASREALQSAKSVSVFAPSCMLADALTKVAFLDEQGGALIRQMGGQAYVLEPGGQFSAL